MPNSPTFSYKPLWKLLIDRDMTKTQLQELAGLSPATIAKLGRGRNVTTDVLARICEALNCDIGDICTSTAENTRDAAKPQRTVH